LSRPDFFREEKKREGEVKGRDLSRPRRGRSSSHRGGKLSCHFPSKRRGRRGDEEKSLPLSLLEGKMVSPGSPLLWKGGAPLSPGEEEEEYLFILERGHSPHLQELQEKGGEEAFPLRPEGGKRGGGSALSLSLCSGMSVFSKG